MRMSVKLQSVGVPPTLFIFEADATLILPFTLRNHFPRALAVEITQMASHPVRHPSQETLMAYGLGRLDDRSAGAIESHLENCSDCSQYLAGISADGFLAVFRRTHSSETEREASSSGAEGASTARISPLSPISLDLQSAYPQIWPACRAIKFSVSWARQLGFRLPCPQSTDGSGRGTQGPAAGDHGSSPGS